MVKDRSDHSQNFGQSTSAGVGLKFVRAREWTTYEISILVGNECCSNVVVRSCEEREAEILKCTRNKESSIQKEGVGRRTKDEQFSLFQVDQLAVGGKMVIPVGPEGGGQKYMLVVKGTGEKITAEPFLDVSYVPLVKVDKSAQEFPSRTR